MPDEKQWSVVQRVLDSLRQEHPTDHIAAALAVASVLIYKCPSCGRLLVFWHGGSAPYSSYLPEDSAD